MNTAAYLAQCAADAAQAGASREAVRILESAAEFAARHFGPGFDDSPMQSHPSVRQRTNAPTGIERGLPREDVS